MRTAHVTTYCGCAAPAVLQRLTDAVRKAAKPQVHVTAVAKYVARKQRKLARKLEQTLAKYRRGVVAKLRVAYGARFGKADNADIIQQMIDELELRKLAEELGVDLTPDMVAAFNKGGANGLAQIGADVLPEMTQQIDAAAVTYAEVRGGELIDDLAGTTEDALRTLLGNAVASGMSTDDLAAEVEDMGAFGEARATAIARTELAFAHVAGNMDSWSQSDQVVGKRSLLGDLHDKDDVCDECAAAGVVGLDEDFVDGYAQPPYHPNCVCDVVPVLSGEENAA